jgi:hypothetical protein
MLISNRVSTRTAFLARTVPFRFPPQKRYSDDYELFLRLVLAGCPAAEIGMELAANYRPPSTKGGVSGRLVAMELGELDTYWQVTRARLLAPVFLPLLWGLSLLKFVRRALTVRFS